VLGNEHPRTLVSINNLGDIYRKRQKYSQAEALYGEALEVRRRVLGPLHRDTLASLTSLAEVKLQLQKYTEAEGLLREAVASREKATPDSWERYHAQSLLGSVLARQRRYDAAEPLLLAGYQGLTERAAGIPAPDRSAYVGQAGDRIARLYQDWGKPDKAAHWRAAPKAR
jgi:tetratricopeptide (TPR) repeat protein